MSTRDKDIETLVKIKSLAEKAFTENARVYDSNRTYDVGRAKSGRDKANVAGLTFAQVVLALEALGYQPDDPEKPNKINGPKTGKPKF